MKLAAFGLAMTLLSAFAADVKFEHSPKLQLAVDQSIEAAALSFSNRKLNLEQMAVTVVDVSDPAHLRFASHRGQERIYPASVVKMFYLEAAHRWMEEGKLRDTPELRRAMRDMIVDSYNEATHYVLDLLTGTTSGPELPDAEMTEWAHKRNAVNRYFAGRGYPEINANQKPWCEGPYGRDHIFVGETYTNRNMLTTDATARLLAEIALGQAVSKKRSEEMLELMKRDPGAESGDPDGQARGFTGPAIPRGAKLWSKAGWTSKTRHDAALIDMPNGARVVLVIFTVDHANERGIIPTVARPILQQFEP
jgi:hypothetical protein